uniref:Uncharacterized protein n=1 Tax=Anguilla anguilla TaxID=7936 RepID=A0A0E9VMF2_ANGAN
MSVESFVTKLVRRRVITDLNDQ